MRHATQCCLWSEYKLSISYCLAERYGNAKSSGLTVLCAGKDLIFGHLFLVQSHVCCIYDLGFGTE